MHPVARRTLGAVLLDRDGTLIRHVHHLTDPNSVELLPSAATGVRMMRSLGVKLAVCSNQSVVGRGLCTADRVEEVNLRMLELLAREGAILDAILYCPHHPDDQCDCRKPATGLGVRAAELLEVAPDETAVVGDQASDVAFGAALGVKTVLIAPDGTDPSAHGASCVAPDLVAAARWLRRLQEVGDADRSDRVSSDPTSALMLPPLAAPGIHVRSTAADAPRRGD